MLMLFVLLAPAIAAIIKVFGTMFGKMAPLAKAIGASGAVKGIGQGIMGQAPAKGAGLGQNLGRVAGGRLMGGGGKKAGGMMAAPSMDVASPDQLNPPQTLPTRGQLQAQQLNDFLRSIRGRV